MTRKVVILGRVLPVWLAVILLITSGTGAAVGTVFAGKITGEINVTTGQSLLVGSPICDFIKHTPNDVIAVDTTPGAGWDPTAVWPFAGVVTLADLSKLAFIDGEYQVSGVVGLPNGSQYFKFYVGDRSNITKLVVSHRGKADAAAQLMVWTGAWTNLGTVGTTDETRTFTITSSSAATLDQVIKLGWVYIGLNGNPTLWTDYISVTATYTAIDFASWEGFTGPEITNRKLVVPNRCIGVHSDDQAAFEAAAELTVGDWWMFMLPVKNTSQNDMTARLTMQVPSCLNVYVVSPNEIPDNDIRVTRVTQIGINTWKVIVKAGAAKQDDDDYLYIIINAHNDCPPGIFTIDGIFEQIPY